MYIEKDLNRNEIFCTIMKKIEKVIMKVWKNHKKNQKLVTIPKSCDIDEGDYVEIKKIST